MSNDNPQDPSGMTSWVPLALGVGTVFVGLLYGLYQSKYKTQEKTVKEDVANDMTAGWVGKNPKSRYK